MLTPYLLFIKIAAGLALIASILFAGHQVADHWRDQGRVEIQAKWDEADRLRHKAENEAITKRNAENAKQILIYEAKNKEVQREYERRIELQNRNNERDIADLLAHGGLRLPATFCSGFASKANAASASIDHEESGTRLPEQVENDLFQFADERDKEIIQLGACQSWIRDNGFYTGENTQP